ncbi:MAG: TonB-dependent receptor [Saprospiraceae bacterium]|nr:MAG: TonB-dependent receptor [Saprospiraceae bacterium]
MKYVTAKFCINPTVNALFFLLFSLTLSAQSITVTGTVVDDSSLNGIGGAEVRIGLQVTQTDAKGSFELEVNSGNNKTFIAVSKDGYIILEKEISVGAGATVSMGTLALTPEASEVIAEDLIPTITLAAEDVDQDEVPNISGILTSSRDVFINTAAFTFGRARFRIRGYENLNSNLYMNGIPVNDLESGGVYWSQWGGLNDVTRNRTNSVGLSPVSFGIASVGGASSIDTRASYQRKQLRVSYAAANTTYRNRVMATWSTGMMPNGWAVTLSGSHRWAEEAYIPGTFYDAYAYFLSVDRKLGDKHLLNLTAFGAPIKRGKSGAGTQELFDLSGSNYYNPNWGYQNGEKRNARVANTHQPMVILRHDWTPSDDFTMTTSASYQTGRNGGTALDWYNARDPRPDYYRRLPSYIDNEQAVLVEQRLRENPERLQLDWDRMYAVNRHSYGTIENANGIEGNTVSGLRAQYVIEDRRYDSDRINFSTAMQYNASDKLTLNGGLIYQYFKGDNFKVLEDLLGADFYLDIDKFAEFDAAGDNDFIQNDLNNPNRILKEGDVFGYHYENHLRKGSAWAQAQLSLRKLDFFVGGDVASVKFWRNGLVRNGKFPNNSLGESEKTDFFDYNVKAGVTYKIDGRNYLILNGAYGLRAPFTREVYLSPRTRNSVSPFLEQEKIVSIEGGYQLKSPNAKVRLMGYYTRFEDQLFNRSFYLDNATQGGTSGGFVNYFMHNIDTRHMGVEIAGEIAVTSSLKVSAVAALGQYIYLNRPNVTFFLDNETSELVNSRKVYIKNFNVPGTPQTAYSLGLSYRSKNYWFANLNFNYYDDIWIDFYPERRTDAAVSYVDDPQYIDQIVTPESDLWNEILDQEKAPAAFTIDFFGGKSWKIDDLYIALNVGISNILDKKDFITGGYEQFRFDFEDKNVDRFPNRYFNSFGRTYYISLAFSL